MVVRNASAPLLFVRCQAFSPPADPRKFLDHQAGFSPCHENAAALPRTPLGRSPRFGGRFGGGGGGGDFLLGRLPARGTAIVVVVVVVVHGEQDLREVRGELVVGRVARPGHQALDPAVLEPLEGGLGEFGPAIVAALGPDLRGGFQDAQGPAESLPPFCDEVVVELVDALRHFGPGDQLGDPAVKLTFFRRGCRRLLRSLALSLLLLLVGRGMFDTEKVGDDREMVHVPIGSIGDKSFIDEDFYGRIVTSRPEFGVKLCSDGNG